MSIDDFDRSVQRQENDFQRLPALELEPQEYLADLDEFDMTEEQKIKLLETLWSIMRSFVELGFEFDVSEQAVDDKGNE